MVFTGNRAQRGLNHVTACCQGSVPFISTHSVLQSLHSHCVGLMGLFIQRWMGQPSLLRSEVFSDVSQMLPHSFCQQWQMEFWKNFHEMSCIRPD